MTEREHGVLDERTMFALWTSSSPAARASYLADARPAYDAVPRSAPRDRAIRCAHCHAAAWVRVGWGGMNRRYCSGACRSAAHYRRAHGFRGRRMDQILAALAAHPAGLTAVEIAAAIGHRGRPVTLRWLIAYHRRVNGVPVEAVPVGRFRRYVVREGIAS